MKYKLLTIGSLCCSIFFSVTAAAPARGISTMTFDQPSLQELKAAVEAHPDSPAIHERYIAAFRKSIPGANFRNYDSVLSLLKPQYAKWMKRFPNNAVVPFAIGHAFCGVESANAKPYLLKAVAIDPKMAKAWMDLATDAQRWGDFDASDSYIEKAKEAEPQNPEYAAYYVFSMQRTSFARYRELSLDFINRFSDSDRSAQMLYWVAYLSTDENEKLHFFKLLKENYSPAKFSWSASAMSGYFDLLLPKKPEEALAIAQEMQSVSTDDYSRKTWGQNLGMAQSVIRANKALDEHRPADALTALADVHPGRYSDSREFIALLKARAMDAAGNTMNAYDSLAAFYAKTPSDAVMSMMTGYASRLGKDTAWINGDVQQKLMAAAQAAPDFDLYDYLTGRNVSLKDYRGKVLLVTFWFPGCGPCRGEFPHFEEAMIKYKGQDIAYVGINVVPGQDTYVLPFMHSSGYTFTPLRDKDQAVAKAYHVNGTPANFLIDRDGRIVFSSFMIQNPKAQHMLDLMIGSLLAQRS